VSISPDNHYIAAGGQNSLLLIWDKNTGDIIHTLSGHTDAITSIAISPDNSTILSGSWDGTLKRWSLSEGRLLNTFSNAQIICETISYHGNSGTILAGYWDGSILMHDIGSGQIPVRFKGHTKNIIGLYSDTAHGRIVSCSRDGSIRLWNSIDGQCIAQFLLFENNEWIIMTADGYYTASAHGIDYVMIKQGDANISSEEYCKKYNRSDIIVNQLK